MLPLVLVISSCVVDTPTIADTQVATAPTPTSGPQLEPTTAPAPTAAPTPTTPPPPTPTPTPEPEPTPTPPPEPAPLPTARPDSDFVPTDVPAGTVAIPIGSTTFELATARPVLQLGGHTLIYVDSDFQAEVDIFTPAATRDGALLGSYADVLNVVMTDPVFAQLEGQAPETIAGLPAVVFEGTVASPDRVFITDTSALDDALGWFPPVRLRLWLIDRPAGPIIVSAESLEDPGQFPQAMQLAAQVLTTISFG